MGVAPAGALISGDAGLLYTCRPSRALKVGRSSMGISYGISIALTKESLWDFYRRIGYRGRYSLV